MTPKIYLLSQIVENRMKGNKELEQLVETLEKGGDKEIIKEVTQKI